MSVHFHGHLYAATRVFLNARNIPEDHPAVEILKDMETTAYYVDRNSSGYILAQHIFQAILGWKDMLNHYLKVGAPFVLWFFLTQHFRVLLSLFPMLI